MPKKTKRGAGSRKGRQRKLIPLTEVSKRTGISMPTLLRYKKAHQGRIPAVGEGRSQRYPLSAIPVFEQIKKENRRSKKKRASKAASEELLSLVEVGRRTGISYPTLLRYVKLHLERIPHEGRGRSRRYPSSAVRVFKAIRGESRRGRKAAGPDRVVVGADPRLRQQIRELERTQRHISRQLKTVLDTLKKPLVVTVKPR